MYVRSIRGPNIQKHIFFFLIGAITAYAILTEFNKARQSLFNVLTGASWAHQVKPGVEVRNAFNTANWAKILDALDKIGVSPHLLAMMRIYFEDRVLDYDTAVDNNIPLLRECLLVTA